MTQRADIRLLTIAEAAEYCGLTVSGYRAAVRDGRLPGPVPGFRRYDKRAIDRALNKPSGIEDDTRTEYQKWKAGRNEGHAQAR